MKTKKPAKPKSPGTEARTYLTRSLKRDLHSRMRILSIRRLRTLEDIVNDALTIGVEALEREVTGR